MRNRRTSTLLLLTASSLTAAGCPHIRSSDGLVVARRPWQMIQAAPPPTPREPLPDRAAPTQRSQSQAARSGTTIRFRRPIQQDANEQHKSSPAESIAAAKRSAIQQASPETLLDSVQTFDFLPGAVYEVITTPGFVSVLRMEPGERILHLAAGDTSRWLLETIDAAAAIGTGQVPVTVRGGAAATRQTSVLIKPRRPDIATNLVLATDRRTYLIDLVSTSGPHHSVVEWTYPRPPVVHPSSKGPKPPIGEPARRNYAYLVKAPRGRVPSWLPASVYDDGARVYVQFPSGVQHRRMPPIFVIEPDGAVRMVNFHVRGRTYVIDELFNKAELRLGGQRVVIERLKPKPQGLFRRCLTTFRGDHNE